MAWSVVLAALAVSAVLPVGALRARNSTIAAHDASAAAPKMTFQRFYNAHKTGRGIWKWNDALDAYQRHFQVYQGHPVNLAEVGIQSGGSVLMWQAVLGEQCHVYGLDINPAVNSFANEKTTITIGDQADVAMWNSFFANTAKSLDILIDDGGHEAHQMIVTLEQSFSGLNEGGYVAIEDIHGQHYLDSFFTPAAGYLAKMAGEGKLASVHVYPYLLITRRAGKAPTAPADELTFSGSSEVVADFGALWEAVPRHKGGHVVLQNAGWGPFFTTQGIDNFFRHFGALHDGNFYDSPAGCQHTSAAVCATIVQNSEMQATVTGVHIYNDRLVVEIAGAPTVIQAQRAGDTWLEYR